MRSDLEYLQNPLSITTDEIRIKLSHLVKILAKWQYNSIVFNSEGAMRWLTGIKHQLGDIAPSAISPVNVLIHVDNNKGIKISIAAKEFEMSRLKSEIPQLFNAVKGLKYEFCQSLPTPAYNSLQADNSNYQLVIDQIIRPLLGGFSGSQYKKLNKLSNVTMKVLTETARQLYPGMNGMEARGLLLYNLGRHNIDANLTLIALSGQEFYLHPIASANYVVEKGKWLKLVVGSRFAEHIVSQSLMVKLGGRVSEYEQTVYHALQDAAIEYADCYRVGAIEHGVYAEIIERFQKVEHKYGLKGFAKSATLHHLGGGTSPLGNRDQMLDPVGNKILSPWTQFAINPVDTLAGFKVELQGIIQPKKKPPFILKMSEFTNGLNFRKVTAEGGTTAKLPELLII
jgi:Metallopeptidase family M24